MRRWARRLAPFTALVSVVGLASGCAERKYESELVVEAVDDTTPLSHRFTYTVESGGETIQVQGLLEDDFRYKLQMSTEAGPAIEQVVSDDTVAVRFLDPALLVSYVDELAAGEVDLATDVPGATVLDALSASRWVVDTRGAPNVLAGGPDEREGGLGFSGDSLYDARTALAYIRTAGEGQFFQRYDPESLEPTYRTDEDPFPAPADDSGIIRYDSIIFDLPAVRDATQGSQSVLPGYRHFRKMAVYVDGDGRIIRVMEFIGLTPRTREQLIDYARALLDLTNAPAETLAAFDQDMARLRSDPLAVDEYLLTGLNSFRELAGSAPIIFRTMTLDLQDFGAADIAVQLPSDGVIHGDLAVLRNLGRKPAGVLDTGPDSAGVLASDATGTTVAGGGAAAGSSTTTTTTAPPGG